ncbi:MAG: hypothetical protein JWM72_181 [Actinomycetia bacterium]|nr:hypothetical protein [Actinomycetes bacterium]
MLKLLTRGVRVRWTQYLLSAAAIAIGVALVSGTVVLAQSARSSYTKLLHPSSTGTDLFVRGPETDVRQGISDFAPVPDALLQRVRAVPGVAAAEGQVVRIGQLVTVAGKFLEADRPNYVYSWMASKELSSFDLTAGRAPAVPGEVAVSDATARLSGLRTGDPIGLSVDAGSPRAARIVGLVQRRSGPDLTGADAVFVDPAWAQRLTGIGDRWDLIEVTATPDVMVETLRDRINGVIPGDGTSVITRAQYDNAQLANLARRSSSLTAILLALSLLAFVVGCGLVFNTFSLLSAQRTRELSLLRTVGMARSQVYLSVVGEAAIVGAVASTIGAFAGLPAAYGLRRLAVLSGRDTDIGAIHLNFAIVAVAALVGTLACVAIATIPARRASNVLPIAAWRDAQPSAPEGIPARFALVPAFVAFVGAVLLLVSTFVNGAREGLEVAGAVTLTLAVVGALPVCAPSLFRVLGAWAGRTGAAGSVAGTSAESNPRRVLAPVLALVLGLGMVTTVAVLAGSAHAAMHQLVSRADKADYVVVSDSAPGIDVEAIEKLAEAPAVRVASEMGDDTFDRAGHAEQFTALDGDTATLVLDLPVVSGTLAHFVDGDILVTRSAARRWNYHVGDFVPARFGLPRRRYLRVDAIIADNGITHDWVIPFETYRRGYLSAPIRAVFVKGVPGVDAARLRAQVDTGVNGFPGVSVLDAPAYARSQAVKAEGPIALVQALVGLSILVALLGVANSLSLSVVERVWELGLLDVLGMTPAQVSLTVQWEAVFIAVAGVVFGVAGGLVLGLGFADAAGVHGFTRLTVPVGTIGGAALLVVVAAFVAATIPARRAVRLSEVAAVNRLA